jgi:hypothetical protein
MAEGGKTKTSFTSAVNLYLRSKPALAKPIGNLEAFLLLSFCSEKASRFESLNCVDHGQLAERIPG